MTYAERFEAQLAKQCERRGLEDDQEKRAFRKHLKDQYGKDLAKMTERELRTVQIHLDASFREYFGGAKRKPAEE